MKALGIPRFEKRKDLFKFLVENKTSLIAQKKSILKGLNPDYPAMDIPFMNTPIFMEKNAVLKADAAVNMELDVLPVLAVINTTNIIDSYLDLHLPKMWNRSLKQNKKSILHLQEHQMKFANIISDGDDLEAFVQNYTWKELGFPQFKGETEGLTFRSQVRKDRNPYMHEQYAKKRVKNHSVGMQYVDMVMCIDDKDYGAEFEAWEKYIEMAVNPDAADEHGYFWAIKEGKVMEGSAVPRGANVATPTLEAGKDDPEEPEITKSEGIDYLYLAKNFSL